MIVAHIAPNKSSAFNANSRNPQVKLCFVLNSLATHETQGLGDRLSLPDSICQATTVYQVMTLT